MKDGAPQRFLFMQSAPADALFYDAAELYQGAPVSQVGGIDGLDGEAASALADGVEYTGLTVAGGRRHPAQSRQQHRRGPCRWWPTSSA